MAGLLDALQWMQSPQRTQQMQQLGGLLSSAVQNLRNSRQQQTDTWNQTFQDPNRPLHVTNPEAFKQLAAQSMDAVSFAPAGIFVGAGAKTWNAAAAKAAEALEKAGVAPREIWAKTGTWRAPDGNWKQEIADNTAEFRTNFDASAASKANNYVSGLEGPLGGMYRHQALYDAYPGLLTTDRMSVTKLADWLPDSTNTGMHSRTFSGKGMTELRNKTEEGALNSAVHELQHGVQNLEGWQAGGTESRFRDTPEMSAFEQYRRLSGEAEARAAAARQTLTPEQRRQMFPEDSYDVPLGSLIFGR